MRPRPADPGPPDPDDLSPDRIAAALADRGFTYRGQTMYLGSQVDELLAAVAERMRRLQRRADGLEEALDGRAPAPDGGPLLTRDEHAAVALCNQLWEVLLVVVGTGRNRIPDLEELIPHVRAVQNAVLAQAAARAYPDRYRLLGEQIDEGEDG